jgi:hypothetical protein
MLVIKRSGEKEDFDAGKTLQGIMRSGASRAEADEVLARLTPQLYEGISTEEIYRKVRALLDHRSAARFGIKKGLMGLGPDGRHFETLIGHLMRAEGWDVTVRIMMEGRCVSHEIDLLMAKGGERTIAECKFHNSLGCKCSIQTALYVQARWEDLSARSGMIPPLLVTNTRFSSEVEKYAQCVGMHLLGWKYPGQGGLESLLEQHGLLPVTVLPLRRQELNLLLERDIVLASEVLTRRSEVAPLLGRDPYAKAAAQAELLR